MQSQKDYANYLTPSLPLPRTSLLDHPKFRSFSLFPPPLSFFFLSLSGVFSWNLVVFEGRSPQTWTLRQKEQQWRVSNTLTWKLRHHTPQKRASSLETRATRGATLVCRCALAAAHDRIACHRDLQACWKTQNPKLMAGLRQLHQEAPRPGAPATAQQTPPI